MLITPFLAGTILCLLSGSSVTKEETSATVVEAGQSAEALIRLAEEHFNRGGFAAAADIYQQLEKLGYGQFALYFNQGNVSLLAGRLPEAILAYRRAERCEPWDSKLQANLADARSLVLDNPAGDWTPRNALLGAHEVLLLVTYLCACFFLGVLVEGRIERKMLPKPVPVEDSSDPWLQAFMRNYEWLCREVEKWLPLARTKWWKWVWAGCVVVTASLTVGAWWEDNFHAHHPIAVLAADGVLLRKGNGDSYPAVEVNRVPIKLNKGVEARVRTQKSNGWVQLELGEKLIGWVPAKAVLIDTAD